MSSGSSDFCNKRILSSTGYWIMPVNAEQIHVKFHCTYCQPLHLLLHMCSRNYKRMYVKYTGSLLSSLINFASSRLYYKVCNPALRKASAWWRWQEGSSSHMPSASGPLSGLIDGLKRPLTSQRTKRKGLSQWWCLFPASWEKGGRRKVLSRQIVPVVVVLRPRDSH